MNLYVFTRGLSDYTPGVALIVANSYKQAMQLAVSKLNESAKKGAAWDRCTVYPYNPVSADDSTILHYEGGG